MTIAEYCYSIAGAGNHEGAEEIRVRPMALALSLISEGFSVIPLCRDGKIPTRKWKPYQERLATMDELIEWFIENDYTPAIVTGPISGITAIDCDSPEAIQEAESCFITSELTQATKRGRHFIFRHSGERNTVKVGGTPGIDRRGQGGYIKAYPDSIHWTREAVNQAPFLNPIYGN